MRAFVHLIIRKSYLKRAGGSTEEGPPSSHICCLICFLLHRLKPDRVLCSSSSSKGEGREGREGREDDGTGVEFTHPAGRARYWCDESLVLLWKTGGMLVIFDLDEGKCDCLLSQDVFEYIKFGMLSKDKVKKAFNDKIPKWNHVNYTYL